MKSYRGYAEVHDWNTSRHFRRPHKRRDMIAWQEQAREEMEEMAENTYAYVIINEWTPEGSQNSTTEIVDTRFFASEDEAWGRLGQIAEAYGVTLDQDLSSFVAPPEVGIEVSEYYIEELWGNG